MISLLTPVFNGETYIAELCDSLLLQDADFEHVVHDGASTDQTLGILDSYSSSYQMSYKSEKDGGMYDGLCKAYERSTGDILGWINSDDILLPNVLACVQSVFDDNPDVNWIAGIPSILTSRGIESYPFMPIYHKRLVRSGLYHGNLMGAIPQESMFYRRSLWEKVNPRSFLPQYRLAGDYRLWCEFAKYARPCSAPYIFAAFRRHEAQLSSDAKAYWQEANANYARLPKIPGGRFIHRLNSCIFAQLMQPLV